MLPKICSSTLKRMRCGLYLSKAFWDNKLKLKKHHYFYLIFKQFRQNLALNFYLPIYSRKIYHSPLASFLKFPSDYFERNILFFNIKRKIIWNALSDMSRWTNRMCIFVRETYFDKAYNFYKITKIAVL